jgi:hypothetical protein
LLLGGALFALVGVQFLNYAPDDVYITLRYAKNIADGHGAVYNAGERVEGYSNPVFLAVLAALPPALRTPARMVTAAKLIGLAGGLLALLLIALLARRDPEAGEDWGLAPLLFGLAGYPAFWAASGLETGLHVLFVVLAIGGYVRALETGRKAWRLLTGLLFGALALSRPEGPIFLVAAFVARGALLIRDRKKPDWADAGCALLGLAPLAGYFIWRHAFYGLWWPNTFYAKAGGGLSTWTDGARYLLMALGPALWGNALLLPLAFAGLAPWRKASPRTIVLLTAIGAQAGFVLLAGGDWMPGWRFLVPAMPLLALLAPSVFRRVVNATNHKRVGEWLHGWREWLVLALLLAPIASHLYVVRQLSYAPSGWRGYQVREFFAASYREVADWLSARAAPGDWLATGEAGLIPYLTDLPTIDCFGLTDAHLAKRPGKRHEKVDPDYILNRRPRFIVIGGGRLDGPRLSSDFAYGRSLLDHPRLAGEYELALRAGSFFVLERRAP